MSTVLYNSFMKNNKKQWKDSFLIPPGLFKEEEDEGFEKLTYFLKKFHAYTNLSFRVSIKW